MKKILVVDDEPDINLILTTFLEASGFETFSAKDGIEAVELARSEHPDLVILDVMMPELDGFQVARLLRSDDRTSGMRVLMLTARNQQSDRFWGMDSGASAYLGKPFELSEVLATIRSLLAE
ncbi:MAG TPA: response regulator [Oscillatoriaceae cyanobacterium]